MAACLSASAAPSYCVPADGVYCLGCAWRDGNCGDGECKGLHAEPQTRSRQRSWPMPQVPKLIITAGPERSGSTWLFNAVRLLYEDAQEPLDAYWITHLTDAALDARGCEREGTPAQQRPHVLVKTHGWSDDWARRRASHVLLTHRDLRGVVASYRRMGWAPDLKPAYIADHLRWHAIADRDVALEDIMAAPQRELDALAATLGLAEKVDTAAVLARLQALRAPARGPPDPVNKLWPRHLSAATLQRQAGGGPVAQAPASGADLKARFPEYFSLYGYD
ncbi:hypothetical protein WJX81_000617 [Elliptochloris bilobata]|uniref:Sulfotransferase n=1 Tax=Elliptochloris bilobata TaxID=381761 RepID=A0AAW1QA11_9CHLO